MTASKSPRRRSPGSLYLPWPDLLPDCLRTEGVTSAQVPGCWGAGSSCQELTRSSFPGTQRTGHTPGTGNQVAFTKAASGTCLWASLGSLHSNFCLSRLTKKDQGARSPSLLSSSRPDDFSRGSVQFPFLPSPNSDSPSTPTPPRASFVWIFFSTMVPPYSSLQTSF